MDFWKVPSGEITNLPYLVEIAKTGKPIIGITYVASSISVILQVAYFKLSGGKRIFLMAPLHHHYQKKGYAEPKIVQRFMIICIILAVTTIVTLKLR